MNKNVVEGNGGGTTFSHGKIGIFQHKIISQKYNNDGHKYHTPYEIVSGSVFEYYFVFDFKKSIFYEKTEQNKTGQIHLDCEI